MRIAYVCEGGGRVGWGHIGRGRAMLEVADPGSALVVGRGLDDISLWCKKNGVDLPLLPWSSPAEPVVAAEYDVVIVDQYTLSADWIAAASQVRPTFVVDDWMRSNATATGLINPNVGAQRSSYCSVQAREWCLGPDFALLRSEIREIERSNVEAAEFARHLLVTLGGSDPGGWTAQIAQDLVQLPWYKLGGAMTIVLGASYTGPEPWTDWPAEWTMHLEVVRQPMDFARRCAQADVVVCGAGTTTYEMAYLGRPFVPVGLVDNQARITREWCNVGVGAAVAVWEASWRGRLRQAVTELLTLPEKRAAAAAIVAGLVDGRGVERLLKVCRSAMHGEA